MIIMFNPVETRREGLEKAMAHFEGSDGHLETETLKTATRALLVPVETNKHWLVDIVEKYTMGALTNALIIQVRAFPEGHHEWLFNPQGKKG
jgi:hypothetical protein